MKTNLITKKIKDNIPALLTKSRLEKMYNDRNLSVLWALQNFDGPKGWREHKNDDYVVAWAKLDEGNVSWHLPRELVSKTGLKRQQEPWDGHDRKQKLDRLERHVNEEIRINPKSKSKSQDQLKGEKIES